MKIDASIILDTKYDQRLIKYVCCELLGIQLRSLTFTQDLLFLVARYGGFLCRIHRIRVDGSRIRKEKVAGSKISGYVWTGLKAVKFVHRGA